MVRRKFDRVLVWDVSRLGRPLQDLAEFFDDARSKGTNLYIHQSGLDTGTPTGRMMFQMVGVFAEFERGIISERVKAGLSRVKGQGKRLGRPLSITPEIRAEVLNLIESGNPYSYITKAVGIPKGTVSRIKKESKEIRLNG